MRKVLKSAKNEKGTVLVAAILILVLLTLLGVTGIYTSITERSIAVNDQIYKQTFYGAEAGRSYVFANKDLYDHIEMDKGKLFPDKIDPADINSEFKDYNDSTTLPTEKEPVGGGVSFNGYVIYESAPPETEKFLIGRGCDPDDCAAYAYRMVVRGHGPRKAMVSVEAGFFDIRLK